MKRRREVTSSTNVPEPAHTRGDRGVSVAKQRTSCFNCGDIQEGYLFSSFGIFNALPVEPQVAIDFLEPAAMSLASGETGFATCDNLAITSIFDFADPCRQFEFSVTSTSASVCWEDISRNLQITAELLGNRHTLPAISLHAATSFITLPGVDALRVTISPAWWSHATSFTIVGLHHAGNLIDTPLLPASIEVMHLNHTPSKAGRVRMSSKAGDLAGVISAIKDGCSTEESNDKVCTPAYAPCRG